MVRDRRNNRPEARWLYSPRKIAPAFLTFVITFKRILRHNLQMLGSNSIDRVDSVVQIVGDQDVAVIVPGIFRESPFWKAPVRSRPPPRKPSSASSSLVVTENRGSQLVMLCLGQQVRSHKAGIGSLVRQHQDLAGAGDGVDAHDSRNTAFFARATKMFPGPTILSTFGDQTPYRKPWRRWPGRRRPCRSQSTPASFAATRADRMQTFPFRAGVAMMISSTPATLAGTMFMRTEEG